MTKQKTTKTKTWPSFYQWKRIFKVLTKKEKIAFFGFFVLFLTSSSFLAVNFYFKNTEIGPASGGQYIEGLVGWPRFINPIYAPAKDVDRDLTELIFSGLMKYNSEGQIEKDLARGYESKEDGKTLELTLKDNVFWHDGERFTADDVVFTIKTIQSPDYKSPLRANWLGVKVEKIDDYKLSFNLKNPYSAFLERLTLKILPQHIWQDVSPENFPLSVYNLQPIGTGPYQFKEIKQNQSGAVISLDLIAYPNYFDKKPFIQQLSFLFFDKEEDLIQAAKRGEIKGFSAYQPDPLLNQAGPELNKYSYSLPRYFSIFFNQDKSKFLKKVEVRQALSYGLNKEELLKEVLFDKGRIILSPILPEIYGYQPPSKIYEFDPKKAEELLEKAGFEKKEGKFVEIVKEKAVEFKTRLEYGDKGEEVLTLQTCLAKDPEIYPEGKITGYFGSATKQAVIRFQEKYGSEILVPVGYKKGTGIVADATRAKLNQVCQPPIKEILPLKLSLVTAEEPLLKKTAELVKKQWEALGLEVEIKTAAISQLESDFMKPREYDCLLFGEALGIIPDPFPFWHSSQKNDPGLNLAKYENKKADELLEKARTTLDAEARKELYQKFQDILIEDAPAAFLYSPDYFYLVSKEIKGVKESKLLVDPSKRFIGIENWYIVEERQWH